MTTRLSSSSNILFVTIDALRYDRIGYAGYRPTPCPQLDKLFERSVWLSNAFTTGSPTQFALPGIFTSTLPLDQGGYDLGIRNRSASFVEVLREAGYRTVGMAVAGWANRLHGYDRGFETYHHLFDISLFLQTFLNVDINYLAERYREGTVTLERCEERIAPKLPLVFDFLKGLCREKADEVASPLIPNSPIFHQWQFASIERVIVAEEEKFTANSMAYVTALLDPGTSNPVFHSIPGMKSDPRKASAAYTIETFNRWLELERSGPFFAWLHLMDVHDSNWTSHDIIVSQQNQREEVAQFLILHKNMLVQRKAYRGNFNYDLGIAYMDLQIARLMAMLKARKLLDNTLIVLTADHGLLGTGLPQRESTDVTQFFDELMHVPMAFIHPDLPPASIDTLCTHLDIGPTILDLAGLSIPESFRGRSIFGPEPAQRRHVQMEHLGRGPCEFDIKPMQVCLRSRDYKLVFESPPGSANGDGRVTELYHLAADPEEQMNLANGALLPEAAQPLLELAQKRCREVRASLLSG